MKMRYTFTEIKNRLTINTHHHLFTNGDIEIVKKKPTDGDTLFDLLDVETGLVYTYPNSLFLSLSGTKLAIKLETVTKFNFEDYVINYEKFKDKPSVTFVKIDDSDEFYDKLFSIATELFLFYLDSKEIPPFGCCNSHIKCSEIGHCINTNKELFCGCNYRRHLENGEVYYGNNL